MDRLQLLHFYRERDTAEHEHTAQINGRAALPVTLLTLLAGGFAFYVQNVPRIAGFAGGLFALLAVGSVVFWLLSAVCLGKAWMNYAYAFLPRPLELERWRAALEAYNAQYPGQIRPAEQFEDAIISHLATSATENRKLNVKKSGWVYWCTTWAFGTLAGFVASLVPFLILRGR